MKVWRPQTAYALKQGSAWSDLLGEIADCWTPEDVDAWWTEFILRRHRNYAEGWSLALHNACEDRKADLLNADMDALWKAIVE